MRWSMSIKYLFLNFLLLSALFSPPPAVTAGGWPPTESDMLGPFYKPDAPVRSSVGKGYVLSGVVRSSKDCAPVKGFPVLSISSPLVCRGNSLSLRGPAPFL